MHLLTECRHAIEWGNNLREDIFKSKHLGYLFLIAVMATFFVGVMLFIVDANIKSPADGVWSALSTITHVGFGDVIPVSFFGRMLSAGLILLGLILFSLSTALVSVILIGKNIETFGFERRQVADTQSSFELANNKVVQELTRLHERMDKIEELITSQQIKH